MVMNIVHHKIFSSHHSHFPALFLCILPATLAFTLSFIFVVEFTSELSYVSHLKGSSSQTPNQQFTTVPLAALDLLSASPPPPPQIVPLLPILPPTNKILFLMPHWLAGSKQSCIYPASSFVI